jgi:hypothetical protein
LNGRRRNGSIPANPKTGTVLLSLLDSAPHGEKTTEIRPQGNLKLLRGEERIMRANRLISTLAALAMATTVVVSEAQALEGPLTTGSPAQGTWIGEAENRATSNTDQLAHQTAQVRLNIGKDGSLDGYAPGSGCKLHGQVHPGNHASRLKLDLTVHDCKNAALNGQLKDGEIGLPTPKTAVIKINGRTEANGAKRYITFGAKLARLESADQAKAQPVPYPYIKSQPAAPGAVDLTIPPQAHFMAQAAAKTEPQSKSKVAAKPEARSKSKATAKTDACAKSKATAKTNARSKSKAAAKTDACAKSKATAKTEARSKSKATAKPDARSKSKAAAKSEAHSKSKTAAKSPAHPKTKPATKTEARPKAHAKA